MPEPGGEKIDSEQLAELLKETGIKKTPAIIISALIYESSLSINDLITTTGLTKGRIASGLKHWHHLGWIKSIEGSIRSKGRASHVWSLAFSQEEAFHRLSTQIQEKKHLLEEALRNLERLLE